MPSYKEGTQAMKEAWQVKSCWLHLVLGTVTLYMDSGRSASYILSQERGTESPGIDHHIYSSFLEQECLYCLLLTDFRHFKMSQVGLWLPQAPAFQNVAMVFITQIPGSVNCSGGLFNFLSHICLVTLNCYKKIIIMLKIPISQQKREVVKHSFLSPSVALLKCKLKHQQSRWYMQSLDSVSCHFILCSGAGFFRLADFPPHPNERKSNGALENKNKPTKIKLFPLVGR